LVKKPLVGTKILFFKQKTQTQQQEEIFFLSVGRKRLDAKLFQKLFILGTFHRFCRFWRHLLQLTRAHTWRGNGAEFPFHEHQLFQILFPLVARIFISRRIDGKSVVDRVFQRLAQFLFEIFPRDKVL